MTFLSFLIFFDLDYQIIVQIEKNCQNTPSLKKNEKLPKPFFTNSIHTNKNVVAR